MQRSRLLQLSIYLALSILTSAADGVLGLRTWTNQKGQSLQASFVKIQTEKEGDNSTAIVTFKKKNGKLISFDAELLSDAHQKEIADWLDQNPAGTAPPTPPYSWPSQYRGKTNPKVDYVKYDDNYKAHLYRTKHFDFFVDEKISDATVSKCVAVFDSIVEAIDSLPLGLDTIPKGKRPRYQAILVSSRLKYEEMGGKPDSAGFFSPRRNLTVIPFQSLGIVRKSNKWVFDGKNRDFSVLLHELTHHATSHWIGMPPWFQEGFAEYMSHMPYRSGSFLFTNPGRAVGSKLKNARLASPKATFDLSYPEWSNNLNYTNYATSMVLVYYFMHEDGDGDGHHFIQWMHAWRSAFLAKRNGDYDKLVEQYLMRGRGEKELRDDIQAAMLKKGTRLSLGFSSRINSGFRSHRTPQRSEHFPF